MKIDRFRLLIDPPASGDWNMAVDEALLESAIAGGPATLRFYYWEEPTLSLGYFQSTAERGQHAASASCPLVRRSSGGGAILHDHELTYSISVPVSGARDSAVANDLYDAVHGSLVDVLGEFDMRAELFGSGDGECVASDRRGSEPFLCFQRRACGDVVCSGAKICGSAQRRRRGALLQHGSVLLRRSDFAPELPGLAEQSGKAISGAELRVCWQNALGGRVGSSFVEGRITSAERDRAELLASSRFGVAEFAGRR